MMELRTSMIEVVSMAMRKNAASVRVDNFGAVRIDSGEPIARMRQR